VEYELKTMTITAVMAVLVAIPLILGRKRLQSIRTKNEEDQTASIDNNQRYDIEEFLT